ncbi:MAG: hypothetical protein IPK02_02545 [Candidatus Accumulibacter sp.]|uniref:Uncharacterized protein n=1 Tax=Candidatus Accumulibacter affinis TaxID=2954384 RepID=A0A935T8J1_9PROT|nr:hypothetical protein [Candidatus Accumulibacter affinis]
MHQCVGSPPVTLKVMFHALLDAFAMLVLASGLLWLARRETLFIPDVPISMASAVITGVAGAALMLWSAARRLRELARRRADSKLP